MARVQSYSKDSSLNEKDKLLGSSFISTANGADVFQTGNFTLGDLAEYFANFQISDNQLYNFATISQQVTTNVSNISSNATYSLNLASNFGTFDANGNLTSLSEAFANSVMTTTTAQDSASATALTNLTAIVNNNTASITTNAADITAVSASATTNASNITTNGNNITSVTTTANANAVNIATLTSGLSTANTNISQNATDLTSLTADVTTNTTNITNNGTSITTNTTNITTNASDITTLTNNLATANTAITQNATDVTSLTSTVTTNTSDITTANTNITTANTNIATNAAAITTLTNNLVTTDANVTQNASDVTTLTTNVTTNTTNIATNTSDITTANTNITTNATNITTLTNDLTTAQADITQNATNHTSLSSTVTTNTTNITGKPNVYRQAAAPAVSVPIGSIWYDSDDGNKLYVLVSGSPNVWTATDNAGIATNSTAISTNATNIATLTNNLATTDANVTQNATDVTSLTTDVTTNTTNIATNTGDITTANTNITTNATNITTLTNNLTTAEADIVQNASDVTSLTSTVATNTSNIGTAQTDITTNATNISTLSTGLTTANTNITANSTDITTLDTAVTNNGTNITANATNITSLSTTVGNNTTSITTNATSINGIQGKYGVTIDSNGALTGFDLIGGGGASIFKINADDFKIYNSGGDLNPFSVSGGVVQVNGNLNVSGTASITGSSNTGQFIACDFKNSGSSGLSSIRVLNNTNYYGLFRLNTTVAGDIGYYGIDLVIGPDTGGGEKRLANFNGGGISLGTYSTGIFFNDAWLGGTTNNSAGGIRVKGSSDGQATQAMFITVPSNQASSTPALAIEDNSSNSLFKVFKNSHVETGSLTTSGAIRGASLTSDAGITASGAIATNSTVKGTQFIDHDNAVYYLDPASTSNLNAATFVGTISGQNQYLAQDLGIGFTSGNIGGKLDIVSNSVGINIKNNYGTAGSGTIGLLGYTTSGMLTSGAYHLVFQADNGIGSVANMLLCDLNGNLRNFNNSYGQISDINLKENITPATNKLEEVKQLEVKNFNFIGNDLKQIGLIAQDVEQIFPGLVENIETPQGDAVKSVKYSVLVPILIKAIQELEARVATLEG